MFTNDSIEDYTFLPPELYDVIDRFQRLDFVWGFEVELLADALSQ